MSLKYLGAYGHEVLLPTIKSLAAEIPNAVVRPLKVIQKATASDGSPIYALFATKREIPLDWGVLTWAEVQSLQTLANLNQELKYQDQDESTTWYNVIILSFEYRKVSSISTSTNKHYQAQMVLGEV